MRIRKAHFIGIAGKGMSATALLLRQLGSEVGGSDEACYPPVSDYLLAAGIPFVEGYKKENIPPDADAIVIGKNAKLIPETNEEVRAAFESGKKIFSFPDILEVLTKGKETIVVAGSYGKSTCTALLTWCLKEAGKDPSYFIGEVTKGFDTYAHIGKGPVFVLEGDEYPSSHWDDQSKFLHYNAKNILLTSATHDHLNIFRTHEDYLKPFKKLVSSLPREGILVANAGELHARALANDSAARKVFYALEENAGWYAKNINYGERTTFTLMRGNEHVAKLSTILLGAHNVENIIGVSAMLLEKNLLAPEELQKGVETFQGVKRRMESLAVRSNTPVFEGFGSSYEKARAAILAMQKHFPARRLLVAFEPNTFSWRNRASLAQYERVFDGAAKIYLFAPPHDGKDTQLSVQEIAQRVRKGGGDAIVADTAEQMFELFEKEMRAEDAVLLLSSGAFGGLTKSIPRLAEYKFPNTFNIRYS